MTLHPRAPRPAPALACELEPAPPRDMTTRVITTEAEWAIQSDRTLAESVACVALRLDRTEAEVIGFAARSSNHAHDPEAMKAHALATWQRARALLASLSPVERRAVQRTWAAESKVARAAQQAKRAKERLQLAEERLQLARKGHLAAAAPLDRLDVEARYLLDVPAPFKDQSEARDDAPAPSTSEARP